jgi:hypothetical protein
MLVPVYETTPRHIPQYGNLNTRRSENHLAPLRTRPNSICIRLSQLQSVVHSSNWLQQQRTPATWSNTDAWLGAVKVQPCALWLPLSHVTLVINL